MRARTRRAPRRRRPMSEVRPAPPRGRAPGATAPLLQVRGLNVAYGDVQVLWDVDLEIYAGEIVALVGANGAGKSTLLSTLSGLLRPRGGDILLAGRPLAGRPTHEVVSAGLVQVPE